MKTDEFKVGHFYVKKGGWLVRKLYAENDQCDFYCRSYDLKTGKAKGDSLKCSVFLMAQWDEREATPEEASRFDRTEADRRDLKEALGLADVVLKSVSDELLLSEVRQRG